MKKLFTLMIAASGLIFIMTSGTLDKNGKIGKTNSPSETTCNDSRCHTSFALNSGPATINVSCPEMPSWEYVPGDTYTVAVEIAQTGKTLYGIDLEVLTPSNANAGTILNIHSDSTQLANYTGASPSRVNLTHITRGGAVAAAGKTWTFRWIAPSDTSIHTATMYYALNASDASNSVSGDYIYTRNQVFTQKVNTGTGILNNNELNADIRIFPNPASENLNLNGILSSEDPYTIRLYDLNGRIQKSFAENEKSGHYINRQFDISDVATGLYLLEISQGSERKVQKVVVR